MAKPRFVIAEQADFRLCYSRFESKSEQFFCGKVFLGREMSGAANDVNSFRRKNTKLCLPNIFVRFVARYCFLRTLFLERVSRGF